MGIASQSTGYSEHRSRPGFPAKMRSGMQCFSVCGLTDDVNHVSCPSLQFSPNISPLLNASRIRALRHFFRAASLLH
mgnify:CR=1 FL=1